MNKENIRNAKNFDELLEAKYGKIGTENRDNFEEKAQYFVISEMLKDARKEANMVESLEERAHAYCDKVKPYYDEIRYHADKLELMVDNEFWVLTKYREMLFTR